MDSIYTRYIYPDVYVVSEHRLNKRMSKITFSGWAEPLVFAAKVSLLLVLGL